MLTLGHVPGTVGASGEIGPFRTTCEDEWLVEVVMRQDVPLETIRCYNITLTLLGTFSASFPWQQTGKVLDLPHQAGDRLGDLSHLAGFRGKVCPGVEGRGKA